MTQHHHKDMRTDSTDKYQKNLESRPIGVQNEENAYNLTQLNTQKLMSFHSCCQSPLSDEIMNADTLTLVPILQISIV